MSQDLQKDSPTSPTKVEASSGASFVQNILKEIAEFKGWELIFQALLTGFVFWALYSLKIIYDFHTLEEWTHIPKYSVYDFKLAILMIAVFMGYKSAVHRIFFNFFKNMLDQTKFPTDEERSLRAKVHCQWIANVIYYTFSTTTAFLLFKNQEFFPKVLGGKGEPINMYIGVPYRQDIPYSIPFYMVQFGWHLQTLIEYCVYKRNTPKFWEMFLHHCLAVFLIFFSYMTCNVRVGILVLFVHDPCDIFLCAGRINADFKNSSNVFKIVNFVLFVFTWLFCRLYVFPRYIVGGGFDQYLQRESGMLNSAFLFLILMMGALVILHAYWFLLILRILVVMLTGTKNYNVYDNSKKNKN